MKTAQKNFSKRHRSIEDGTQTFKRRERTGRETSKELQEKQDIKYMKEAVKQAKKAYALGEVPIGCVIVYEDKIIGRGYNRRTIDKNTLGPRGASGDPQGEPEDE